MRDRKRDTELHIQQLNDEYWRLKKRLKTIVFQIELFGGKIPEPECIIVLRSIKYATTDEKIDVYHSEFGWTNWVIEAMKLIQKPCTLKEIAEKVGDNDKKLYFSKVLIRVKEIVRLMLENNQIGLLPNSKQKYFLK